jgi:endogenous inhibitor of DNA gyrase (YacG/DUF329 family)
MKIKCAFCETELDRSPSRLKRNGGLGFCDKLCQHSYYFAKSPDINIRCASCGKKIHRYQSRINRDEYARHFCNKRCESQWRKTHPHPNRFREGNPGPQGMKN